MAKKNETTTRFNVDISQLKSGIQEANRQIKLANAQFKAASSSMEDWGKSSDGLKAKISQLNTVFQAESSKLDNLKKQLEIVEREQGENSKGADDLRIAIANQQATVNKTAQALKNYENKLSKLEAANNETASSYDKLDDKIKGQRTKLDELKKAYSNAVLEQGKSSKEAKGLAKEIKALSSDLKSNTTAMNKVDNAADSLDRTLEEVDDTTIDVSGGFTVLKGAMAQLVADGVKSLISGFANLASETREYREDMAKLATGFEQGGFTAEQATKVYKDFYAVLGEEDRSVEAVNHLAKLVDSEEDLATWTDICTGVWGTFGDSLPIEGLTEAANETAKVGTVTGPLADALNWAGESEDAFNDKLAECTSEQERQALITSTLNSLYGEAATKYRENNKAVMEANAANSNLTDAYAALGKKAEPIITSIKQGMADLLNAAMELVNGVDFSKVAESISAGFSDFTENIMPKIIDGFKWIIENKDLLIGGITAIGTAFLTWKVVSIVTTAVTAVKGFVTALQAGKTVMQALNLTMAANPIGLIITAIAGLTAAFIYFWNTSDAFRQFWIDLWETIKNAVQIAIEWIQDAFANVSEYLTEKFQAFKTMVSTTIESIKAFFTSLIDDIIAQLTLVWNVILEIFGPAIDWFSQLFSSIYASLESIITVIIGLCKGTWEIICRIFEVASEWFNENVIQPIVELFTALWDGIQNAATTTYNAIVNAFSKVANWFNENVIQPVSNYFSKMWSKTKSGASDAWSGIKSVFGKVADFFGDVFGKAWKKVKDVFSTGGKIFDGIKEGIVDAFKTIVNKLIDGINKVVSMPFNSINKMLNKIRNTSFLGISPFKDLWSENPLSIPEIPHLARGGVLAKGQLGLLEGNGAEAVVPLENNAGWIRKTAKDLKNQLMSEGGIYNNQPQEIINNYTYNQTNNSPKALSRLEIYRQTKNQLAFMKGV